MSYLIVCDNVTCRIVEGSLYPELTDEIVDATSFQVEGAEHMKLVKQGKWDGYKRFFHKGRRTFPTGLLPRVLRILEEAELHTKVEWNIEVPSRVSIPAVDEVYSLRDYQQASVEEALRHRRGMIRVATGGGKTVIAGHIINRVGSNTIFLVHTKDLLYQAKNMFIEMFGDRFVGQIGDGVVQPAEITVTTIQTAARVLGVKYEKNMYIEEDDWLDDTINLDDDNKARVYWALKAAGLVIMDECHRVAAPTAISVMELLTDANYRIGLSASPWRDDGADLALEAVFGDIIVEVSASDLIKQGHLVRPLIRMIDVPAQYFGKKDKYASVYKEYIVNNDERNNLGVEHAIRMMNRGLPTLILVRHIKHGQDIQQRLSKRGYAIPFLSGSDDAIHRLNTLNALRDGSLRGLIATTIADEGLDVKPLAGLVLLGGGKSSTRALQRVGRVLRPYNGKTHAEIVDFTDNAKFLLFHSHRRADIYQTEPEFIITDV